MRQLNLPSTLLAILGLAILGSGIRAEPLPNTDKLTLEGDISSQLVDGVDRFLLKQLDASIASRAKHWQRDLSSAEAYIKSVAGNRARLAEITGVVDERVTSDNVDTVQLLSLHGEIRAGSGLDGLTVANIRWNSIRNMHGEGLVLLPQQQVTDRIVIVIPDADQTPEMLAGLVEGLPPEQQVASLLAQSGCTVIVPSIINREFKSHGRGNKITNREFAYRAAYELGRHLVGYEVQKILALIDAMDAQFKRRGIDTQRYAVMGWGEGGLLALYSAALDQRIDVTCVSGYFDSRQDAWQEPVSRNVFSLLEQFGDAEIASLVAPRALIIEAARGPELELTGGAGAPIALDSPQPTVVRAEFERARKLLGNKAALVGKLHLVQSGDGSGPFADKATIAALLEALDPDLTAVATPQPIEANTAGLADNAARQARQMQEIDDHNQWLLKKSPLVRKDFMSKLDTSSVEAYEKSVEQYREHFRHEVIGHFDLELLPSNPKTRFVEETEKWTRYEVVLDVFEDVIAYGLITIPKGIKPDERRPVVVCQHGLEGRPQNTIGEEQEQYYSRFATVLAERGFVTFAPQNLYIFRDRFRSLQRKSYLLKKTLFSTIVPQHQQIVNWLKQQPFVDGKRIAFYGLSYGGKSAMRIPPLVTDYCLSICSADFNEWVRKNASTQHTFSYMWTGEYEIFEWNLGSTFNYAEMAYLICPRPFMVERGHFDGVGVDEWVAYEYAKIRFLYAGKLKIPGETEIEWFDGPHKINGVATYKFLHKHLDWPEP
jgi:dienelactone hydrolase